MVAGARLGGCGTAQTTEQPALEPVPHVVTADIQAGIEKHIEDQTRLGGGYFALPFEDRQLRLKLVRVHTEYLANLGPRRHFACVDLASTEGDVFDVDFFLAGDPGAMNVTETTIHKINGQPFYVWTQNPDGTWARSAVEDASRAVLGVIEDGDRFEFLYQAVLPQLTGAARMWIPLPETDAFQTVELAGIEAPGTRRTLTDREYGNKVLFLTLGPQDGGKAIALRFKVDRREKGAYREPGSSLEEFLAPERLVPDNDEIRAITAGVVEGKKGDLVRARALYDHTIDRMRYMKHGAGYGQGDAMYACSARTGNCTDFHSYFIALARAAGIPARFAIGAAIPSERDVGGIDGYHCWAEFYAEGMWWPVDISEGDKYTSLATYYFGHHPANRLELSRGRDLVVEPGPVSGPINYLAYPVLEVAGRPVPVKPLFSFRRITEDE
jgi:transglutaminase-like putative cysteine protease